jgi:hypothetical protein
MGPAESDSRSCAQDAWIKAEILAAKRREAAGAADPAYLEQAMALLAAHEDKLRRTIERRDQFRAELEALRNKAGARPGSPTQAPADWSITIDRRGATGRSRR